MFKTAGNFQFFLKKYILHTGNICDTFGYTLMPKHFHFAVKIKSKEECEMQFKKIKDFPFDSQKHSLSDFLMERFGNLCNSYTKSYNKVYERKGGFLLIISNEQRLTVINTSATLSTIFILMPSIMAFAKSLLIGNGHLFILFLLIKRQG